MMSASSSADHFDCFFAGDSDGCAGCPRLVATEPWDDDVASVAGAGTDEDLLSGWGEDSSSSFGMRRSEISTLAKVHVLGAQSI